MKPIKLKAENTLAGKPIQFREYPGKAFTLQAVQYSSTDPSSHVQIFDKDGDPVSFPIPGDIEPKLITLDAVTVQLPITVIDETSGNSLLLRGVIDR